MALFLSESEKISSHSCHGRVKEDISSILYQLSTMVCRIRLSNTVSSRCHQYDRKVAVGSCSNIRPDTVLSCVYILY